MPMSTSSTWLTRHTSHEYPYGQRMLELEFKWERGSKLESPEIVSVDVYDIFPTTKNPNEVMIKLWENNKQLSRHRKIPGYLIQNARARHRIKISERGKDACNSFVRWSIGIILVAIRSILRFRQSISQPQEIQKPDTFEKPHGKGVNWKALTGRTLRLDVYGEKVKTVLK